MSSDRDPIVEEPISPELVLVDPELARRVRDLDPTPLWLRVAEPAPVPEVTPLPRAATGPAVPAVPVPARAPADRRHRVVGALLLAAGFVLGVILALSLRGSSEVTVARDAVASATRDLPTTTDTIAPSPPPASDPSAQAPSLPAPAPAIRWNPVRYATFYDVVVVDKGSRVLETFPRRPELALSALRARAGRKLKAGRYRWLVRPGFGNPSLRKVAGRTFYGPITSRGVVSIGPSR